MIIALSSFWFAIEARSLASREPDVILIGPDIVRVAQGIDFGFAYIYMQPAFVSTGENDRVEVISDMRLHVLDGPDGATLPTAAFYWDEQARLEEHPETRTLDYRWVADAAPLLVSPSMAQVPFSVFNGPDGWYFVPGTYEMQLVADRTVATAPLTFDFQIDFSDEEVEFLNDQRGNAWMSFPATPID